MAETSGFSTDLPQSAYLAHTIRRAISAAEQRSHRYVTLEHLLLALLDDPDALTLLEGARADLAGLRGATTETVNHSLATLYTPGQFDLRASYKVERVLQSASDDARRMGCMEVDGAFVGVALFHETDSPAYDLLKRHNFVFHAANAWLDRNRNARPRPAPPVAEAEVAEAVEEPVADTDRHAEEADAEILLDEVVEEREQAVDGRSPVGRVRAQGSANPEFGGEIEPVAWPVVRPDAREISGRPDSAGTWSRAGAPTRAAAARPNADYQAGTRQEGDLGTAGRDTSQPSGWERSSATRRSPIEHDRTEREWQPTERTARQQREHAARVEPRLSEASEPARGLGAAVPARVQAGSTVGPELRYPSDPPAAASDQDLGAAVPTRDSATPGRPAESAEVRPLRPHASARERSATTNRAGPGDTGVKESEAPTPNGAVRGVEAERRAPPLAPGAQAPRTEAAVPPAARLDDMRVRSGPMPPPAPPVAKAPTKKPAVATREKDAERSGARPRRRPPSAGSVYAGKLAENIPRRMRAHTRAVVEVRISRDETEGFLAGFEGGAEVFRHSLTVTQAMSVMLRAPDGGFIIENLGPETQWIFKRPGAADKEPFGRWIWSVTPTETGRRRVQLVVAARSVDENGLAGDTALPDQVVTVQVRANYVRGFGSAVRWVVLMALGGLVTEGALFIARTVSQ